MISVVTCTNSRKHTRVSFYDAKFTQGFVETIYDLSNGRYNVINLTGKTGPIDYWSEMNLRDFTPAALRRAGRR